MSHLPLGLSAVLLGLAALYPARTAAQTALQRAGHGLTYRAEAQVTASDGHSPLWLNANRYGLSSVKDDNGYLRAGLFRQADADSAYHWRIGYGVDLATAYDFTSSFVVQQLYADFDWRWLRLSVGSKERPMALKNQELSSGSQTFGINARPIPEVRIEIPHYVSLTGRSNLVAIKGHIGYGLPTDDRWERNYVGPNGQYAAHVLYHSKAGYLRLGNPSRFPLVFEGGLEMACMFGGTVHNFIGGTDLVMTHKLKDFWHAFTGGGSDPTDGNYANSTGNSVGSWLFSLAWQGRDWSLRAYYDHFFEDHSMMFFEYGWKDGLIGVEATLPRNPVVTTLVYEYLHTTDQSGAIYHDYTEAIPDQISAADNYYNHGLYTGWEHWGQAIGNPLFTSPLYNDNRSLSFTGNRFVAHQVGLSGDPLPGLHYRLLYTHMRNWGTYNNPYEDVRYDDSFLAEASYDFAHVPALKGWRIGAAFALDRGQQIGNNTGFQLTLSHQGLLLR